MINHDAVLEDVEALSMSNNLEKMNEADEIDHEQVTELLDRANELLGDDKAIAISAEAIKSNPRIASKIIQSELSAKALVNADAQQYDVANSFKSFTNNWTRTNHIIDHHLNDLKASSKRSLDQFSYQSDENVVWHLLLEANDKNLTHNEFYKLLFELRNPQIGRIIEQAAAISEEELSVSQFIDKFNSALLEISWSNNCFRKTDSTAIYLWPMANDYDLLQYELTFSPKTTTAPVVMKKESITRDPKEKDARYDIPKADIARWVAELPDLYQFDMMIVEKLNKTYNTYISKYKSSKGEKALIYFITASTIAILHHAYIQMAVSLRTVEEAYTEYVVTGFKD